MEKPELEKDYATTFDAIKLKITESALLLKEAQELAKSVNENLYSLYDEEYETDVIQPIFNELEDIGWSTSSLSC